MKVTNIFSLPQALVDAVSVERHNRVQRYNSSKGRL